MAKKMPVLPVAVWQKIVTGAETIFLNFYSYFMTCRVILHNH